MKKRNLQNRVAAFLLALCLLSTMMLGILPAPASAEMTTCDIYFLNSDGWDTVGAYIYGDKGELLGSWGTTMAVADSGSWVKVTAPDAPPFSIIFYNTSDDSQRAELYLGDASNVYVTVNSVAFASKEAAEASVAPAKPDPETTIYFYNSDGWVTVGAHVWNDNGNLTGDWGTTTASASSLGDGWVEVTVPADPTFYVILFNTADDSQRTQQTVSTADAVYVSTVGVYGSQAEAEASVAPVEPDPETRIYFYNSDGWATVGAHAWNDDGNLTGDWGTTTASASSLGDGWVEVTVPADPTFYVILFNTADDSQRTQQTVSTADAVYVSTAGVYGNQAEAEASVAPEEPEKVPTDIYFLNSDGWTSVGAYVYGDKGELLGSWGTTTATADSGSWVKVTAPDAPPFSIIFYNTADDSQRAELYLSDSANVYVTVNAVAFASKEAAEASVAPVEPDPTEPTEPEPTDPEPTETYDLYFLNSEEWASIGAYIYGDKGELLGSWGTTTAVAATELGGNWVKVTASEQPPYSVIFYNTADDSQRVELLIDAADKVYVSLKGAYTTKAEAEASVAPVEPDPIEPTEPVETYDLYFLNSEEWSSVGAYIYGDKGELLGSWGTTTATSAGGDWVKVSVSVLPPYSVIFYNKADDSQRAELFIDAADKVYVTVNAEAFTSKDAAEKSVASAEPEEPQDTYSLYFLNSEGWKSVGAYIYGDKGELLGSWGTTTATAAGGKWVKVSVSALPPYSVIFYNKADESQRAELLIDAANKIYVTVRAQAFTSKAAAESSMAPVATKDLYFLNSEGWKSVGAYIYGDKGELLGSWGTTTATSAGGKWVKVSVPGTPPYSVIFYNKADESQRAELLIDAANKVYVTVRAQAFTSKAAAESSMAPVATSDLYFLNSEGWENVGAYIYGDKGELLGSWGSASAVSAPEIGENWMKVAVPGTPPYSVIFYNKADETQRSELFIDAADKIYVTARAQAFTSSEEAEAALESAGEYEVYFLNSSGWADVGAYIYGDQGELLGSWGSASAVAAPELGESWMKVTVPALPPYSIIFYNKADETQRAELLLDAPDKLYVTAGAEAFTTQAEAEAAAGVTAAIDPDNRDYGPNVEVIDVMVGKPVEEEKSGSGVWIISGAGVAAVAAAAAWLLLKKKKAA